jgi:putative ABC transport system permease protein
MSMAEILTSLELGLIYGIVAIGIYFTFRVLDFPDLTCDGSFMTGSAIAASAVQNGMCPLTALMLGAFAGSLCGLVTGILHGYGRITNLLSGILTAFMLYSINLRIMGVPNLTLPNGIGIEHVGMLGIFGAVIWLISSYVLTTDFGLALRAIGTNPRLASTQGISIAAYTIIGLMLSNALIGMGGALFCLHQGFCDISQGVGTVVIGLAAIIIGKKILPYRSIWCAIFGCIVGSIVYRFVIAISLHSSGIGLKASDMNMITGLILIILMIFSKEKKEASC